VELNLLISIHLKKYILFLMCVGHFYKLTSLSTQQQQKDKVKLP